jgi:hypothetical protein
MSSHKKFILPKTLGVSERKKDYSEVEAKTIIQKSVNNIYREKDFTPALLVYMVETLDAIEKIEKMNLEEEDRKDVEYELRPVIMKVINTYKDILKYKIGEHSEQLIEDMIAGITEGQEDYTSNPLFVYLNELYLYHGYYDKNNKMEEKFKKLNDKSIDIDERNDIFVDILEDFRGDEAKNWWENDLGYRRIMNGWLKNISKDWFKLYDLMKSIKNFFVNKDDTTLKEYIKGYNVLFINSKTIHSEFALYKELEEHIRHLEHHRGLIIAEYFEEIIGKPVEKKFFVLLSDYGSPTLEEWRTEIEKIIEKKLWS